MILEAGSVALISVGLLFFSAGSVGLIRFPDVHSRLHALTKADNLGLGFVVLGASLQAPDGWSIVKLLIIWLLTLAGAATVTQLVARTALENEGRQ